MIAQALQKRVQTYLDLAELSRNDHSVVTIHDFRVSSRNLLAVEPLLRCVSETSQWKKMVRKYLKSLSQLRDTQVLHGNLYGHDQFDTLLLEQMEHSLEEWRAISKNIVDVHFQNNLNASIEIFCSEIKADPPLFNRTAALQWSKTFQKVNMAIQSLGLGTTADDGTGDTLRAGGDKINDNFSEVYTLIGDGTTLSSGISATSTVITLASPTKI